MLDNLKIAAKRQKKLIIIFLITIFLPSIALSVFGVRSIRNERFRLVKQLEDEHKRASTALFPLESAQREKLERAQSFEFRQKKFLLFDHFGSSHLWDSARGKDYRSRDGGFENKIRFCLLCLPRIQDTYNFHKSFDREIFFTKGISGKPNQLCRVNLERGEPQRIDLSMRRLRQLRFHPDGKRIAFSAGYIEVEVWVMENLLLLKKVEKVFK